MDRLLCCSSLMLLTFRRWRGGTGEREQSKVAPFLCDEPTASIGSCCCIIWRRAINQKNAQACARKHTFPEIILWKMSLELSKQEKASSRG